MWAGRLQGEVRIYLSDVRRQIRLTIAPVFARRGRASTVSPAHETETMADRLKAGGS